MRKITSLLFISLLIQAFGSPASVRAQTTEPPTPQAGSSAPPAFGLPDGTPVWLKLTRTLSSKVEKTGETVDFEVVTNVELNEIVVIPKGSIAIATVTKAKPAGRLGKGGKLDIKIDYLRLPTGEKIPLRAVRENKGDNRTGTMTGALVAAGILFFPAAPIFLFIKGKNITIEKGTEVRAYVNGDFPLDPARFVVYPKLVDARESQGVSVKSVPEGAEIEVNGQFVGSTPSTITLKVGEHKIVVKKSGFVAWERMIVVTAGSSVTIDASLEEVQ